MRVRSTILAALLGLGLAGIASGLQGGNQAPPKIKRTFTVRGSFVAFENGDYVHAIVKTSKGEESFFVGGAGLDYFLASHAQKSGSFKIAEVDAFVEEAGGRMTMMRMESARVGRVSSVTWWASLRKRMSVDAISKKYQPLVDKLTRR